MRRNFVNPLTRIAGVGLALLVAALFDARLLRCGRKEACGWGRRVAIRAAIESYVAAYNRGDAKAVASHWSDSGGVDQPRRASGSRERRPSRRSCKACLPKTKVCTSRC